MGAHICCDSQFKSPNTMFLISASEPCFEETSTDDGLSLKSQSSKYSLPSLKMTAWSSENHTHDVYGHCGKLVADLVAPERAHNTVFGLSTARSCYGTGGMLASNRFLADGGSC